MLMTGLPGKPGQHDVSRHAMSVTAMVQMIRAGSVASTAGDYGAINAYRDDEGKLRAQRCVYLRTVEDRTFRSLKTLSRWYRRALVRIGL